MRLFVPVTGFGSLKKDMQVQKRRWEVLGDEGL